MSAVACIGTLKAKVTSPSNWVGPGLAGRIRFVLTPARRTMKP